MRFGLIGCGEIGSLRADAVRRVPGAALTAVSDVDVTRAEGAAGSGACIEEEWTRLVARPDVDAVVVSTPPSLHAEMCIGALGSGKHVLCEKPLARSVEEARTILEARDASGTFLATGFNYRFYPSIAKARELLDAGEIGELDHIRSYTGYSAEEHSHPWLRDAEEMGGGALRDNGIHLIDLTRYFLGEPVEVSGYASNVVWGFPGCEDNGFALLRNAEGKVASLHASWTEFDGYRFSLEIRGTRGYVRATCFPMITKLARAEKPGAKLRKRTFYFPMTHIREHLFSYRAVVVRSFVREIEAFVAASEGGRSEVATGRDGLAALEIAEGAGP